MVFFLFVFLAAYIGKKVVNLSINLIEVFVLKLIKDSLTESFLPVQKWRCHHWLLHLIRIRRQYRCLGYTTHATRPASTFSPSLSSPRVPGLLGVEDWGNLLGTGPGESRTGIPGRRHSTGNGALRETRVTTTRKSAPSGGWAEEEVLITGNCVSSLNWLLERNRRSRKLCAFLETFDKLTGWVFQSEWLIIYFLTIINS